jgi:hypothetical protein
MRHYLGVSGTSLGYDELSRGLRHYLEVYLDVSPNYTASFSNIAMSWDRFDGTLCDGL